MVNNSEARRVLGPTDRPAQELEEKKWKMCCQGQLLLYSKVTSGIDKSFGRITFWKIQPSILPLTSWPLSKRGNPLLVVDSLRAEFVVLQGEIHREGLIETGQRMVTIRAFWIICLSCSTFGEWLFGNFSGPREEANSSTFRIRVQKQLETGRRLKTQQCATELNIRRSTTFWTATFAVPLTSSCTWSVHRVVAE